MPRSTKEPTEKKTKKKEVKTFPVKKLPGLLKRKYSEKKLNKKLLKKIYIPSDKKLVQDLFSAKETNKKGKELIFIPSDKTFTKKELNHLKSIIKEVKSQKGRIKLVPLIAVAGFIFLLVSAIAVSKNFIAKKIIISTVQSIAKARCDIKTVDIKFLDSTFNMKGFEVADKDEPMTNIFSFDSFTVDFDMLQLLKAKFVANELSVEGIKVKSERSYDGSLPPKKLKKLKKNEEKANKEKKTSPFMAELQKKSANSLETVKQSLSGTFEQYNPENMFQNYYANLKTPAISQNIQTEVPLLIEKYSKMPAKYEEEIKKGTEVVNQVVNIDYSSLAQNPVKLKEAVEKITEAYNYTVKIKDDTNATLKDLESDFNKTTTLATNLQKAITQDTNYVQNEINKITSLSLDDGKQFISGTLDSLLYDVMGKYYPYTVKASDFLSNMKKNKKAKEPKVKKEKIKRSEGRNIYYRNDNIPKFWIKKISTSGEGFYGNILNASSDMDKTNKPASGEIELSLYGLDHKASVVVDTRTNSSDPLVTVDYNCDKIPVELPLSYFNNTPGVPGIESSKAYLDCILKIFENDGFALEGSGNIYEAKLITTPFEPAFISDIYTNILSNIQDINLQVKTEFTASKGLDLALNSDIDRIFASALEKEIAKQLEILKKQVQTEVVNKINEYTNNAFGELKTFEDLQKEMKKYTDMANELTKKVEAKQKEVENLMKKGAEKEINNAKEKAQTELKSQLKKLF